MEIKRRTARQPLAMTQSPLPCRNEEGFWWASPSILGRERGRRKANSERHMLHSLSTHGPGCVGLVTASSVKDKPNPATTS